MIRRVRRTTRHRLTTLAFVVCTSAAALAAYAAVAPEPEVPAAVEAVAAVPEPAAPQDEPLIEADPREGLKLDPSKFEVVNGEYIQTLEDGRVAHLSLVPEVQKSMDRIFRQRKVPHGGVVAIEPATGRVLALVSRSYAPKPSEHYALRADAPSASVFKLITAAALLELAQIDPAKPVCYSGGSRSLTAEEIKGNPATDDKCADLGDALAGSLNAVISRLAYYNLTKQDLEEMALRFGFNREIPFELPVDISVANFVDDDIERARTAAGFWNVNLSPLHGALIAAAIANDGVMMRPSIVDSLERDGVETYKMKPEPWLSTISATRARTLAELAEGTTTTGTARKAFHKAKKWPKSLRVTGKTGTLSNKRPYYLFTWFVGSAPLDDPNIAVGALVTNKPKWWVKGMHAAAHTIKTYQEVVEKRREAEEDLSEKGTTPPEGR